MPEEAFSSVDLVAQCLIDEPRSLAFEAAIKEVVKPNHKVIDLGTGSGLMAMFAARAGALDVKALEFDPFIAKVANQNISTNGFSEKIELWLGDARSFDFPEGVNFDVVIMEMLTTAMVDEFQVQAANNLQDRKVVSEKTVFIPKSQQTFVELVNKNFEIYGFVFKMVKHLWNNLSENQKYEVLSEKSLLNDIHFNRKNDEYFDKVIEVKSVKAGEVNAVRLSSRAFLTDKIILDDTETFNAPVIIPIKETKIEADAVIKLRVRYRFGFGYQHLSAEIL
ncbi:MAG: 50S ribosomal protein L11 methyltransferase [Candidatus Paceibacterota bacterium]